MEGKVAVLGDADFVMPFSTLGLDTFAVGPEGDEIVKSAREIIEGRYALVVIAENVARAVEEVFAGQRMKPVPGIVIVPFTAEPEGFATRALGEVLRMATGINILQNS